MFTRYEASFGDDGKDLEPDRGGGGTIANVLSATELLALKWLV